VKCDVKVAEMAFTISAVEECRLAKKHKLKTQKLIPVTALKW
jgi:hypothetical protein